MRQKDGRSIANNNIALLRKCMRLTQRELSLLMSMHTGTVLDITTISRHESKPASRHPSQSELLAYAQVFKVPVVALYADLYDQDKIFTVLSEEGDWIWDTRQQEYVTNGD